MRQKIDALLGTKDNLIKGMKVAELREALKALDLPTKGLKADLQTRLLEASRQADRDANPDPADDTDLDSDSDDLSMDDTGCTETDYEEYDCKDEKCACQPTLIGDQSDRKANIKLWLAADYKFLLVVLGFKGATGNFACIYCKANLSDPREWKKVHDLDERKEDDPPDADTGQPCKNLFPFIPRNRCRIDVLHLLLRCMDRSP